MGGVKLSFKNPAIFFSISYLSRTVNNKFNFKIKEKCQFHLISVDFKTQRGNLEKYTPRVNLLEG